MVIELSGVQFGLKSYARFQNQTSAQHEFNLKSQVHDTKFIYKFITSILRSQNSVAQIQDFLACKNVLLIDEWADLQKVAKDVLHISAIWLVLLNKQLVIVM